MVRRTEMPAALMSGPFSVEDALELGLAPGRLRARDLHRPFRGVRSTEDPGGELRALCDAYLPLMQPGQLFSHVTAARLYGFPLPPRLLAIRDLDVWDEGIQVKANGVIGHRSASVPFRTVDQYPVVAPARVLVQLANLLGRDDFVVAGDFLVCRKEPLCTVDELADAARGARGVRGIRYLRLALDDVRPGTDSPMETKLRLALVRAGLPEPVIGHTITTGSGEFVGTPDLAYIRQKIAIEYEGDVHRTDRRVFVNDIERRERMQEEGWYVIRVISSHLYPSPAWLIARVRRQLILRSSNAL